MKLHKFTLVAFLIWVINSIAGIRLTTEFRPYSVAIIIFIWLIALINIFV